MHLPWRCKFIILYCWGREGDRLTVPGFSNIGIYPEVQVSGSSDSVRFLQTLVVVVPKLKYRNNF